MSEIDSLVDFNDDSPTCTASNTNQNPYNSYDPFQSDPFDPFATQHELQNKETEIFDPFATITSDPTSPEDEFLSYSCDPFNENQERNINSINKHQFDDIYEEEEDLREGSPSTSSTENMTEQAHFEMNGDQNENVIDTSTVHSDGVTKTVTTTSITKKYETTTAEKSREKIIREPKKLENSHYQIKSEEFTKDADKNGNLLHKEQDLVTYSTPGLDYSKTKYQKAAEQESSSVATHNSSNSKWSRSSSNSGTSPPVNKVVINKVAPPEITKNVRSIFENGRFSDVHEIRKLDVANDPLADGGIYESEPIILDGVVRGTDIMNDVKFDAGYALNTRHQFETQKEFQITRDPIKIEAFNPVVIENEPTTLPDDVVRGSMINSEKPSLEGLNLKERMSQLNETKPLLKKEIKLVDDNSSSESNFENQPIIRTDVIRESDSTQNQIDIESGRMKGIQAVFIDGQEKTIERAPIIIDRSTSGITESVPTILEGVAREGDRLEENVLQSGGAKKMKEQWLNIDSEYHSKGRFQMDIDPQGAIILESTPEIRSDVVRCDDVMQDSMTTELGHSKNLADRFNHWGENKPRVERKISIDQSQGCILENEPEQRTDVVKSGGPTGWEIDFEAGHTKNLKEKWCSAAQEADTPKPKPQWQLELESAKECGIFENEPTHNDGVIRECDVVQSTDVPVQTKNLKNLWLNKESEIEAGLAARRSSQPQVSNKPRRILHEFKPRTPTPDSSEETKNEQPIAVETKKEKKSKKKTKKKPVALPNSDEIPDSPASLESNEEEGPDVPDFIAVVQVGSNRAKASMFGERKLTKAEKDRIEAERIAREEAEERRIEEEARLAEELKLQQEEDARRLAKRRPDAWIKHKK